jgi:hypothetical protein
MEIRSWHFQDTFGANQILTFYKGIVTSHAKSGEEERGEIIEYGNGGGIHLNQNIFAQTKIIVNGLSIT